MIVYFADRGMNILGHATTNLPDGYTIKEDTKTEDVESGVATFECKIGYNPENRLALESMLEAGNYLLRKHDNENEFYTIIRAENDSDAQDIYIYAEDAGLDLINEVVGAYEAAEAHTAEWYINLFAAGSGFEIGINEIPDTSTRKLSWDGEATVTERIASVATQFDGFEISYSFDIVGMEVTKKYINIHEQRGKDTGITLRLNQDIDRIITTKSVENLATALKCEGGIPEDEEDPITLEGYSYDDGDFYVDGVYLKSRNAVAKWARIGHTDEGHIVKPYSYETTSQKTLFAHALTELKKVCDVEVNYEVDIATLPDNVKIGDRVNIVDDAGELYVSSRILMLETSIVDQKRSATIGEHLIKGSGITQRVADLAAQFTITAAKVAQARAEAAAAAAKAAQAEADLASAQLQAEAAQTAAEEAQRKADEAAAAAAQAQADAAASAAEVKVAQEAAETARTEAAAAQEVADQAKAEAATAQATADAAKLDAEQAAADIEALGQNLETVSQTMAADYARKTDLTEAEASLQSQISQNAAQISTNVSKLSVLDETVNDAKEQAEQAQTTADAAQDAAEKAVADAETAQTAADNAATLAANAQSKADDASAAAAAAQTAADNAASKATQAEEDLASAKANLETVTSRVDATEEEVAAAKAAVDVAQAAADQAKADAEAAQSTADTAKANAAAAQTAADNAKAAADTAQDTADAAKTAADNAQAAADALAVRVTAAETSIKQNSEQIELMATKTYVEQTLGGYYTKEETDAAIQIESDNITSSVSSKIEGIQVGGRNLALGTSESKTVTGTGSENETFNLYQRSGHTYGCFGDRDVSISFDWSTTATAGTIRIQEGNSPWESFLAHRITVTETNQSGHVEGYVSNFTAASNEDTWLWWAARLDGLTGDVTIANLKIELGNKATDWSPAPEDVDADISDAAETAADAQGTANSNLLAIQQAESIIQQLSNSISQLVTESLSYYQVTYDSTTGVYTATTTVLGEQDGSIVEGAYTADSEQVYVNDSGEYYIISGGTSLMTQTSTGWRFSTKALHDAVNNALTGIETLEEQLGSTDAVVSILQTVVNAHGDTLAYVNIGTYEGSPSIELGETSSTQKLLITNTKIVFSVDGNEETYIDADGLNTDNITVNGEIRQGGFVQINTSDGGWGLLWKGAVE